MSITNAQNAKEMTEIVGDAFSSRDTRNLLPCDDDVIDDVMDDVMDHVTHNNSNGDAAKIRANMQSNRDIGLSPHRCPGLDMMHGNASRPGYDMMHGSTSPPGYDMFTKMFGGRPNPRTPRSSRPNRVLSISGRFYSNASTPPFLNPSRSMEDTVPVSYQTEQSQKFPRWIIILLSNLIGFKLTTNSKPLVATCLYALTLTTGLCHMITYTWYKVYDILSEYTKSTVLTGSVDILICLSWVGIGIYANNLAARLFSTKNFMDSVRVRTKTVFKVSAGALMAFLGTLFVGIRSYYTRGTFHDEYCTKVELNVWICRMFYPSSVCFSVFALVWNLMVGYVLLAVCRTHTVGVRRFIRELDTDGKVFLHYWKCRMMQSTDKNRIDIDSMPHVDESDWYIWDDSADPSVDQTTFTSSSQGNSGSTLNPELNVQNSRFTSSVRSRTSRSGSVPPFAGGGADVASHRISGESNHGNHDDEMCADVENNITDSDIHADRTVTITSRDNPADRTVTGENDNVDTSCIDSSLPADATSDTGCTIEEPTLLTNEDIIVCYWKISCRMRMTSRFLQRWLSSWIGLISLWCADYIIYWTSHEAALSGIAEFLIPLFLLPLICSGYAEVNAEGQRMIWCICPLEERIPIIYFLNQQPLQMTIFNFAVTYKSILGVVLAFSVAFASRMILDEIT